MKLGVFYTKAGITGQVTLMTVSADHNTYHLTLSDGTKIYVIEPDAKGWTVSIPQDYPDMRCVNPILPESIRQKYGITRVAEMVALPSQAAFVKDIAQMFLDDELTFPPAKPKSWLARLKEHVSRNISERKAKAATCSTPPVPQYVEKNTTRQLSKSADTDVKVNLVELLKKQGLHEGTNTVSDGYSNSLDVVVTKAPMRGAWLAATRYFIREEGEAIETPFK